jgi:flagellar P-ring protein precursor FlgI
MGVSRTHKILIAVMWLFATLLVMDSARAERLKDLASISGVRNNQLVGYGIVVGLDGYGDQTTQTPFTVQSIINMLSNMGINLPPGQSLQLKNVAAVMVTATLPPFARPGQQIDVTVASIGNAKGIKGGTLVMAPLKGADGAVYAMAQGHVVTSGAGAAGGGSRVKINQLAVGRIPGGATVEREVKTPVGQGEFVHFDLNDTNFGTARRVTAAINSALGVGTATAVDARQIRVKAPLNADERVAFLGRLEEIEVMPGQTAAKVIFDSRNGAVVMNQAVTLDNCAVSHGNLSVAVTAEGAGIGSTTAIDIRQEGGVIANVKTGANLADVVKALNALGASPTDLMTILQAMKAAGAIRAELEII